MAAPRPNSGPGSVWAVPRSAENPTLPDCRHSCLHLCPLPCHHLVQSDPQGHGLAAAGEASARLGHRRSELRGLPGALGSRRLHVGARVDRGTDHAALVALVQRRRDGRRAAIPRPFLSDWPRLSPGMARGAALRVPPPPPDASADTTLPFRSDLVATLPLGASLQVHALRWAAAEASDRAHRGPVLRRRPPGNGPYGLPAVEDRVANRTESCRRPRVWRRWRR